MRPVWNQSEVEHLTGGSPVIIVLWVIMAIVIAVWLIGLIIGLAGNLIHFLLIIALAILIYNLLAGRRIG